MEVKKRTKRMHELFHSYEPYEGRVGDEMNVLITEESTDGLYFVGHTKSYEQVLVPREHAVMGKVCRVHVVEVSKHSMRAKIIKMDVADVSEIALPMTTKVPKSVAPHMLQKLNNGSVISAVSCHGVSIHSTFFPSDNRLKNPRRFPHFVRDIQDRHFLDRAVLKPGLYLINGALRLCSFHWRYFPFYKTGIDWKSPEFRIQNIDFYKIVSVDLVLEFFKYWNKIHKFVI